MSNVGAVIAFEYPEIADILYKVMPIGYSEGDLRKFGPLPVDGNGSIETYGGTFTFTQSGVPTFTQIDHLTGGWRWKAADLASFFLGTHPLLGDLVADIPQGDLTKILASEQISQDELFETLLPEWSNQLAITEDECASSTPDVDVATFDSEGLFWPQLGSWGPFEHTTRLALQTIYAYAWALGEAPADFQNQCGSSLEWVRDKVLSIKFKLESASPNCALDWLHDFGHEVVDERGAVEVHRMASWLLGVPPENTYNAYNAITSGIRICNRARPPSIAADHYFHAARVLLKWGRDFGHSEWHVFMAVLCARAGLAEIVDLAGLLMHEIHHQDNLCHCGPIRGNGNLCCHEALRRHFVTYLTAELGLPEVSMTTDTTGWQEEGPGNSPGGIVVSDFRWAKDDWHYNSWSGSSDDYFWCAGTEDENCTDASFRADHCGLLRQRHHVGTTWTIPDKCARDMNTNYADTLNRSADDTKCSNTSGYDQCDPIFVPWPAGALSGIGGGTGGVWVDPCGPTLDRECLRVFIADPRIFGGGHWINPCNARPLMPRIPPDFPDLEVPVSQPGDRLGGGN